LVQIFRSLEISYKETLLCSIEIANLITQNLVEIPA